MTSALPKVSVVMAVFNGEKHLAESMDSILAQTFSDFEFIIVNDGSSDGTTGILSACSDPRIVRIERENRGLTRSLIEGTESARGDYIARMDADDVSLTQRLERQVCALDADPEVGLIGTKYCFMDETGAHILPRTVPCSDEELQAVLLEANPFMHGSVMFRRECIERVGAYRESFEFSQDYDLFLRISEQYRIANVPQYLYKHRYSARQISFSRFPEQEAYARIAREQAITRRAGKPDDLDPQAVCVRLAAARKGASHAACPVARKFFNLGDAFYEQGDFGEARRLFRRAARSDPTFGAAWACLLRTLLGKRLMRILRDVRRAVPILGKVMTILAAAGYRRLHRIARGRRNASGSPIVLHLTEAFAYGGVLKVLRRLVPAIGGTQTWEQVVVCPDLPELQGFEREMEGCGIDVISVPRPDGLRLRHVAALKSVLSERRPGIVHVHLHDVYACESALVAAALAGVRRVIATEHIRNACAGRMWRMRKQASNLLVDRTIAVSQGVRDALVRDHHVPARKVVLIRNGIDVTEFCPGRPDAAFVSSTGVGEATPLVGVAAALHPRKGHECLFQAATRVAKEFPEVQFMLAGEGPRECELKALSRQLGLRDRVRFLGFVGDMISFYRAVDLVVLSSFYEGLPLTLLEAMACGKAIVGTDVCGTREVVEDGATGVLVPAGDADSLAGAILRLLRNPGMRESMGKAGRRRVQQMFGFEEMVKRTTALYQQPIVR